MTSKDMAKAPDAKRKPNTPAVVALPGEAQPTSVGQLALQPNIRAAVTIQCYSREYGDLVDTAELTAELNNELSNQARVVNEGDLKRAEGMLMHQHAERLDFGTAGAAVGSDPAMATLETFDGAEVRRG